MDKLVAASVMQGINVIEERLHAVLDIINSIEEREERLLLRRKSFYLISNYLMLKRMITSQYMELDPHQDDYEYYS